MKNVFTIISGIFGNYFYFFCFLILFDHDSHDHQIKNCHNGCHICYGNIERLLRFVIEKSYVGLK